MQTNGNLSDKINQLAIEEVLGKSDWRKDIKNKTNQEQITIQQDIFIGKINETKKEEEEEEETYQELKNRIENEKEEYIDLLLEVEKLRLEK
jgi:hypothetical protein